MGQITEGQRYAISVMRARGCKQKEIAEMIGKDKSVVCRESKRNGSPKTGGYTLTSSSPLLLGIDQASLALPSLTRGVRRCMRAVQGAEAEDVTPQAIHTAGGGCHQEILIEGLVA